VYIDGIQHDIRIDAEAQDFIQKLDLEHQGWKVIRVHWKDIMRDPLGAARSVLFVI
jgi:very-short-patch-repair endonuclease